MNHGYSRYSHGCRCEVCRAAKAAYMRGRRAAARRDARGGWVADSTETHGRAAYEEHGCRCGQCVAAMRPRWRAWTAARRAAA